MFQFNMYAYRYLNTLFGRNLLDIDVMMQQIYVLKKHLFLNGKLNYNYEAKKCVSFQKFVVI